MSKHHYRWTITALTPLHIGNGRRLREGFDFIQQNGYLWIVNQGALFRTVLEQALRSRQGDEAQIAAEIAAMNLYQIRQNGWLRPEHFDLRLGLFSYRLKGSTSKKEERGELHACIKDIEQRPYLPGSSLKGALRSAVLRAAASNDPRKPIYQGNNPKTAASKIERRYFAAPQSDPEHFPYFDLWRALRLSDSSPLPPGSIALAQAIVYRPPAQTRQGLQAESIPLDLEVIPAGATLEMDCWIDTWLFDAPRPAEEPGFSAKQQQWLTAELNQIVNEESRLRLIEETKYFMALSREDEALKSVQQALYNLAREFQALAENEMILPLGKGTGWRSKTLGRVLQEKWTDEEFDQMVQTFKLGRGKWRRNQNIPYTRLLVGASDQPKTPLGWVKIRSAPQET